MYESLEYGILDESLYVLDYVIKKDDNSPRDQ